MGEEKKCINNITDGKYKVDGIRKRLGGFLFGSI
jgi:hypothetical protein